MNHKSRIIFEYQSRYAQRVFPFLTINRNVLPYLTVWVQAYTGIVLLVWQDTADEPKFIQNLKRHNYTASLNQNKTKGNQ